MKIKIEQSSADERAEYVCDSKKHIYKSKRYGWRFITACASNNDKCYEKMCIPPI